MNCPICNEVVAFSLPMHMFAVHGPNGPMVNTQPTTVNNHTVSNQKKKTQPRSWTKRRGNQQTSGKCY